MVGVREKSKSLEVVERSVAQSTPAQEWLSWNEATLEGTLVFCANT